MTRLYCPFFRGKPTLMNELNATNQGGCEVALANSLWGQEGLPFLQPFQMLVDKQFGASLLQTDFSDAGTARRQIDDWVSGKTHGRIMNIVPAPLPSAETRMMLVNAIYFKARWETVFSDAYTMDSPFYMEPGKPLSVKMMHLTKSFRYAETNGLQFLILPYHLEKFSMIVVLPKKIDGLPELEKTLNAPQLEQLQRISGEEEVDVSLPRFKGKSAFSLEKALQEMGMRDAFSMERADFSGITSGKPLFVEAAIHQACVETDEVGTEMAAGTIVLGSLSATRPFNFKADHPFLFLIRHNPTGAILFMGRVANPSEKTGED